MEMNALKPDSHVAQQSRRERLRIQHHFQELHNDNLEWPTAVNYPVQNPDRNVRNITNFVYDPSLISSDMINFLTNSQRDASFIATTQDSHQQSNDWMLNYAIGDGRSQNPMIASGVMMPNNTVNDNDTLMHQSSSWGSHDWNEHGVDLPNFRNQSSELINFDAIRSIEADPNTQRLSLSLSHNSHFNGAYESHDSIPKPSIISRGTSGKSINETVGITNPTYRCTGPLGPFTGYATILKCSKFLMPAQELLDEFCSSKSFDHRRVLLSGEVCSNSLSGIGVSKSRVVITNVDEVSVVSSSTYHSSNEVTGDCGIGCSNSDSCRPDYQQTKAKLICLQEEVCRKYKQYHQQMQMVVSSFESVSGLHAASPYISMAIKSVSRNFRGLKNAILDQLRHIGNALGEDLLSTGAASSSDVGNFKYTNKISGFQDKKFGGGPTGNVGIMEPQCVWRSQRGLPERSVAVLRVWLFGHFLHPYPTDTDKHMLAAQTGLTRNQVSNWFINARVRIWKPMVEEIHNLENSRATESNKNSHNLTDEKPTAEGTSRNIKFNATSEKQLEEQLEVPEIGTLGNIGSRNLGMEQWNRGKHGGYCELPAAVLDSNSLMGFVPYHHQRSHGLEIGGIGAVSLTLELRHGMENGQQQAQLLQHEDQLRNQFHFVDRLN